MKHFMHDEETGTVSILDDRFYFSEKTEEYYPSVTTILDAYPKGYGFTNWLKQVGYNSDLIVKKAGEDGQLTHNLIEDYLMGHELVWYNKSVPTYEYHIWEMLCKFDEFWKRYNPKIIAVEKKLVSESHNTGGRLDLICEIEGEVWLIDFKSSNAMYRSYELQLAAYATMWNEHKDVPTIERTGILWLKSLTRGEDKRGKKIQGKGWQLVEPSNHYSDDFAMFEKVRDIWFDSNTVNPKNIEMPNSLSIKSTVEV